MMFTREDYKTPNEELYQKITETLTVLAAGGKENA